MSAPPGGTDWRPPHGYSQQVGWDGSAVVKTFSEEAVERRERELAVLRALGGLLPVPELLPSRGRLDLRMTYVPGILAQEWIVARLGPKLVARHVALMEECGRYLHRLHELGTAGLAGMLPGTGSVVVHGDYAPYNMIVASENARIRALVDWELAHLGHPVEDLAWLECNMRDWYSSDAEVVGALYRGYGATFDWETRHQAMIERSLPHLELSLRPGVPEAHREGTRRHIDKMLEFHEIL
jgi:aminoglycoside phosphotransferase (APT) family kinase protein